jgi:hypothetical protein
MSPVFKNGPDWQVEMPLRARLKMISVLAVMLAVSGAGGIFLWVRGNPDRIPVTLMIVLGATGLLLLVLGGFFFWYSNRYPEWPLPRAMRALRGKMVAAVGLLVIWYLLGGLMGVFLMDNFIGWSQLPIVLSVLIGLGLVPLGDAFRKPMLFLWAFLIVLMAVLLLIAMPNWQAFCAQVQGAWITLVLWTLTLDQYRLIHKQITDTPA